MENEVVRFFKYEYKCQEDAEAAIYNFYAKQKKKDNLVKHFAKSAISKIGKLYDMFKFDYNLEYEKYMAKSTSMEDLERRQQIWDNLYKNRYKYNKYV